MHSQFSMSSRTPLRASASSFVLRAPQAQLPATAARRRRRVRRDDRDVLLCRSSPDTIIGFALPTSSSFVAHSSLPVFESNARKRRSSVAPTKTRPPAVTVGPALPLPPVFCFPAGRKSFTPSVVSHAISPVFALTAISRDHGGRWHGRIDVAAGRVLPRRRGERVERSDAVHRRAIVERAASRRVSKLYVTPGFFFSTQPTSDVSCEFT